MIARNIAKEVHAALSDTPVVLIHGARQTGKSTLVQSIARTHHPARYMTLDDATVLAAAESDPDGFIQVQEGPIVIDEVQHVPALFRAIKAAVDRDRRPGRFLLTGSANVLLLPRLSESLAGRMEVLTLWPFSQGEIIGRREQFIDTVFEDHLPTTIPLDAPLWPRVIQGGYPESLSRNTVKRRRAWFNAYLTTILQRDIRDLAQIEGLTTFPRLLSLLSTRTASLVNYSELSRTIGLPLSTLKRYLTLLETTFLVHFLDAWSANVGKRLVKAPKLMMGDTGLAAQLLGITEVSLTTNRTQLGALLENFVAMELVKQITWSDLQPTRYHFRSHTQQEVDIVLEDASGRLVGIEVKSGSRVAASDFKGLRTLASICPETFHRGLILYDGTEVVAFDPHFAAIPISALWHW